jgi:hypothetical protein
MRRLAFSPNVAGKPLFRTSYAAPRLEQGRALPGDGPHGRDDHGEHTGRSMAATLRRVPHNIKPPMRAQGEIGERGQIVAILPERQEFAIEFKCEANATLQVLLDNGDALALPGRDGLVHFHE